MNLKVAFGARRLRPSVRRLTALAGLRTSRKSNGGTLLYTLVGIRGGRAWTSDPEDDFFNLTVYLRDGRKYG